MHQRAHREYFRLLVLRGACLADDKRYTGTIRVRGGGVIRVQCEVVRDVKGTAADTGA